MSSFGEELIPKPFVEALRVLQDSAPSRPASYVRAVISEELGVPSEQLFASIDDVPAPHSESDMSSMAIGPADSLDGWPAWVL